MNNGTIIKLSFTAVIGLALLKIAGLVLWSWWIVLTPIGLVMLIFILYILAGIVVGIYEEFTGDQDD